MATTKNLGIPLLGNKDLVGNKGINDAFEKIDSMATPKSHIDTNGHWKLWAKNTAYKKQDIFRTSTIPSWGFWEVTTAGTSGIAEPFGAGEGDVATDGTCKLILRRLTAATGIDSWALWKIFKPKTAYRVGDVFRTKTCPSWGFWVVIKAGTSDETAPYGQKEGDIAESGDMKCQLSRLLNSADICTKKKALTYSLLF